MGVSLSQSATASFPDRPAGRTGTGLLVTMTAGSGSSYLEHDLGAELPAFHVRVMVGKATCSGGAVVFMRGLSALGVESFSMSYNGSTRRVHLDLASGYSSYWNVATALPWTCVEFSVTATQLYVWINGEERADISGDYSAVATKLLRIGCSSKDSAATGTLWLDEWIIADSYIGPVVVAPDPALPPAADPARWLVLYRDSGDYAVWAEWYRQQRGIPLSNMCPTRLFNTTETGADDDARDAVAAYIALNFPVGRIVGIVIGYGVCSVDPDTYQSFASMLADLGAGTHAAGKANPTYVPGVVGADDLPDRDSLYGGGKYLVGELNAPSLAAAESLTTAVDGLSVEAADGLVITTLDAANETYAASVASGAWPAMVAFSSSVQAQLMRLPLDDAFDGTAHGNAIEFTDATAGSFEGDEDLAILWTVGASAAALVRSGSGLAKAAIEEGYPIAIGHVTTPPAADLGNPAAFFAALRAGWTLAEATAVAFPTLNASWRVIGDPLAVLPMPLAGFNVTAEPSGALLAVVPPSAAAELLLDDLLTPGTVELRIAATDQYGTESEQTAISVQVNEDGTASELMFEPSRLVTSQAAGGMVRVDWLAFDPAGDRTQPAEYEVAELGNTGTVLATVAASTITPAYSAVVGPFGDGRTVRLVVRSSDGSGHYGAWIPAPAIVADASAPPVPVVLRT